MKKWRHYVEFIPPNLATGTLFVAETNGARSKVHVPGFNMWFAASQENNPNPTMAYANVLLHEVFWQGVLDKRDKIFAGDPGQIGSRDASIDKFRDMTNVAEELSEIFQFRYTPPSGGQRTSLQTPSGAFASGQARPGASAPSTPFGLALGGSFMRNFPLE